MNKNNSSGIGILGILLIIFIVLKLLNVINWSWLVVFIPLWISLGMFIVGLLIIIVMYLINENKR
ncbi:MAG: hypothetical protein SPI06_10865 [Terrisporobacter sp.]|uniref:hypothetical protein n=1 Tax=Terrisporobacter sp. TaxID=1965305 RepID=UPI002A9119DD|nr:hypothetical protein [Terrisporobacter sp.]MDY6153898.1 hypothetical protein [Terrisporobacter sp.]